MKQTILLLTLLLMPLLAKKQLAFDADEYHVSLNMALVYHTPYDILGNRTTGGGFTVALDKSLMHKAAFSLGGDIQTVWYAQTSADAAYSITPRFRLGFHPLGLSVIRGEVPIAYHIDPYIMLKAGIHIDSRLDNPIYPAISPITLGIRWYFSDTFALTFESDSWYDLSLGVGFWF